MGWKTSLILIENTDELTDDGKILQAIGKSDYEFEGEVTFEESLYPGDKSISIGLFNGNIIICDDYQLTDKMLDPRQELNLSKVEEDLVQLFPSSEILAVACHSVVNYHGYSFIDKGVKKRLKVISSDEPRVAFGDRLPEEDEVYKLLNSSEEDLTEDVLMEDFTFGVAKRRLKVQIDHVEADVLMQDVAFRKYRSPEGAENSRKSVPEEKESKWKRFGFIILVIILLQILRRLLF